MKFLKVDNCFINIEHVKMFGVNVMSPGDEENKYYFDICVNNGQEPLNLSIPLIGFVDNTQYDLFTKNLFRFTNYKNSPGVFDVQKNVLDVLEETVGNAVLYRDGEVAIRTETKEDD